LLKRTLSLPTTILYGLGTIIGAGIYVLIGKVVATAGSYTPYSFLISGVIALFTALSYAELCSRYPRAAGAAIYIKEAWHKKPLTHLVGILLILTAIVSSGTLAHGFAGYASSFIDLPEILIAVSVLILLGALACWGIEESATLIVIVTILEIFGLIYVCFVASYNMPTDIIQIKTTETFSLTSIFLGSFLAFYAFIGFEDMANLVEEVKEPKRNMPLAITLSVIAAITIYMIIALVIIKSVPLNIIAGSKAPLADLIKATGRSPLIITAISLIAVINGILVQIIMASRVIYGLAKENYFPKKLAQVNSKTKTPIYATTIVTIAIIIAVTSLDLLTLAKSTSFIVLTIFILVNLSLIKIKLNPKTPNTTSTCYHITIPILGLLTSTALLLAELIY